MIELMIFILGLVIGIAGTYCWHKAQSSLVKAHHQEKLSLLEVAREQMKHEFSQISQVIFEEKGKKFTEQNQTNLTNLIQPLKEQIKSFEKKVQDTYEKESHDRITLFHEIKHLKDLNQQISKDAINLTQALKGEAKTQGTWGEVILERVLSLSGLQKGREYETQVSLKDEDNRTYQPDVIVHLPDNKDIIVDSKVSLVAYERLQSAPEQEKPQYLSAHLQSLRAHIKMLSDKQYQKLKGVQTLDFVLMFIPIEPALTVAMQADEALFNEALTRNIVMVTPSTLLATLRTIQNIWRFDYQNQNAVKIAQKAGDLYDKFVGFVEDLQELGKRMDSTQKTYEAAMNKLTDGRGNMVKRVQELKTMGAATVKNLDQHLLLQADTDEQETLEQI